MGNPIAEGVVSLTPGYDRELESGEMLIVVSAVKSVRYEILLRNRSIIYRTSRRGSETQSEVDLFSNIIY